MPPSDATHLHPATPRKRQRARAAGHVAKSSDLISAVVLLGGVVFVLLFGEMWLSAVLEIAQQRWGEMASTQISAEWIEGFMGDALKLFTLFVIPAFFLFFGLPLMVHLLQTRFLLHFSGVLPSLSRMGFAQWKQRTVSSNHWMHLVFNLGKLGIVFAIALWFFARRGPDILAIASNSGGQVAFSLGHLLMRLAIELSIALVILGLFDLFYQRYRYEHDIMMTEEELREETQNR